MWRMVVARMLMGSLEIAIIGHLLLVQGVLIVNQSLYLQGTQRLVAPSSVLLARR
jgi:hypothetical protein